MMSCLRVGTGVAILTDDQFMSGDCGLVQPSINASKQMLSNVTDICKDLWTRPVARPVFQPFLFWRPQGPHIDELSILN